MGQYHKAVNLTKREFINPHKLGCGLKLWEQLANNPGTGAALTILLACSNGRGGGDLGENDVIGRWAGDNIAIVGDYAEETDLPLKYHTDTIYGLCDEDNPNGYLDITDLVAAVIEKELNGKFVGDGWKEFQRNG